MAYIYFQLPIYGLITSVVLFISNFFRTVSNVCEISSHEDKESDEDSHADDNEIPNENDSDTNSCDMESIERCVQ